MSMGSIPRARARARAGESSVPGRKVATAVVAAFTLCVSVLAAGPAQAAGPSGENARPAPPQLGARFSSTGAVQRAGALGDLIGPLHIVNRNSNKCLTIL